MYRRVTLGSLIWALPDPGEAASAVLDGHCERSHDGLLCTRDENHLMPHRAGVGLGHDFSRAQTNGMFPYAAEWDDNRFTDNIPPLAPVGTEVES